MSDYGAYLDASENAWRTRYGGRRDAPQHRNIPASVDCNLDLGERIVEKLKSEIGAEQTAELLESYALKANGLQPSGQQGVIDLDCDDSDAEVAKVPYGF